VQEADGFYDEKVWHLCAVELEMQFTEQEILAIYQKTVSSRKW
jgi:hypothetical protein